jgi:hypothetical protein
VHRSVGDFGAVGDGKTDDTKAIQAAIDAHRGTSLQKAPATVYFPPGVYLVSDTIVIYFHTYLFGPPSGWSAHPECRATLVLAEGASGFGSTTALKPLIATNNGFNRTMDGQWWVDPVDKVGPMVNRLDSFFQLCASNPFWSTCGLLHAVSLSCGGLLPVQPQDTLGSPRYPDRACIDSLSSL